MFQLSNKRYKDRFYSEALKATTRDLLMDLLANQGDPQADPDEGPSNARASEDDTGEPAAKVPRRSFLSSMFGEMMEDSPQAQADVTLASQLNLYLSEPPIPCETKKTSENGNEKVTVPETPLEYWKRSKDRFPALIPVARAFLSAPSTSVDSERLFSAAALVLNEKRNRLSAEKTEKLLFIKYNLPAMLGLPPSKSDD